MASRNLDIAALRAVLTVSETGSVTRAAHLLNLTQSAVSMQIRRLEEMLDKVLFDRAARKMQPTPEGRVLLEHARRICSENDEALARLTGPEAVTNVRFGLPHDLVRPQMPRLLRELAIHWPMVRLQLASRRSGTLRRMFEAGEFDMVLTTEEQPGPGAEVLSEDQLVWIGAKDGRALRERPLRLSLEEGCAFHAAAIKALKQAGIVSEPAFDGNSDEMASAAVAADMGVAVRMSRDLPPGCEVLGPESGLPPLGLTRICLYDTGQLRGAPVDGLREKLRAAYR
ncbi:LysR family transcriptional regulator [Thioclava dalianensis]|uniref:LysR family transcriptional regulator n=1 Tax=Thioclava dalianensis TaxID=1185766 RepID=A0A074U9L2_9RHOB|nr:LysR family transcriptional regulator [Thioclava dalianensis]KEP71367.1 LysR family transcriptional regulator [Thioclava dalianensis]SFM78404.1 DNA-binding transcriptional regulator, LysR family [Thioclava dalianensis]